MTSPSRRKRRTTAPGRSTPAPTTPSAWLGVFLVGLLGGGPALAQNPSPYAPVASARPGAIAPAAPALPVAKAGPSSAWGSIRPDPAPSLAPYPEIIPARYQPPNPDETPTITVQLEPPGLERFSKLETELQ